MNFETLKGKTLKKIEQIREEELIFTTVDGYKYKLFHDYSCCESVYIEDVCGDLEDLVGNPILIAEEVKSREAIKGQSKPEDSDNSFTWTFYKIDTIKGGVTIRWYGESNGWYSEEVDFCKL